MSNTNNIILENNSLKYEIINLHTKMNSMEEQLQQITKTNTKLENELSKIKLRYDGLRILCIKRLNSLMVK